MSVLDAFNTNAFKTLSLTNALNKLPFAPSRIGQMGLFTPRGITDTAVILEERSGTLALLPSKSRGTPGSASAEPVRKARNFIIPHIPHDDLILAGDVQDVRKFGSEDEKEGITQVVNDRLTTMRQRHEVTLEFLRIGCLNGVILDGDPTVTLFNLFTEFSVTETVVDFLTGTATTPIREKCLDVKRAIELALGSSVFDHVHVLCSQTFFEDLIKHADVAAAFDRFQDGAFKRADPRAGFEFAQVVFEEYSGSIGGQKFITEGDARAFPVGSQNMFIEHFAPADFIEAVNTVGLPVYAKQQRMDFDRGIQLHTQSNPLPMCANPAVLIRCHSSN